MADKVKLHTPTIISVVLLLALLLAFVDPGFAGLITSNVIWLFVLNFLQTIFVWWASR